MDVSHQTIESIVAEVIADHQRGLKRRSRSAKHRAGDELTYRRGLLSTLDRQQLLSLIGQHLHESESTRNGATVRACYKTPVRRV